MSKTIIISERDNIAAVSKEGRVMEFYIHRGEILLGDIFLAQVENVLPSIDAAFVNVGSDKMGFLHASDIVGKGVLTELVKPKQNIIVQVVKEPTGHKGPRVTTSISMPGRFLVLMPFEKGINVSRKISSAKERARLKSIVNLIKPPGIGIIIRTEAENQSEGEIQEDLEFLLEKWNNVITVGDTIVPPNLLHRDQDLLYRVIREACTEDVSEIIVDTSFAYHRAQQLLQSWNIGHPITISAHKGTDSILTAKNIDKEIRTALQTKVNLPSGGYIYIQTTEALTVIDVNSGKFISSATQDETIRKTNLEAVEEIARQLKLRNIGGIIIVDFIDMENRVDQLLVLEQFEMALEPDKAKPQIGQLSDLGLVELTRHRQGQSLAEIFTKKCPACSGIGLVLEEFNFVVPPQEGELAAKAQKLKHFKPALPARTRVGIPDPKRNFNEHHQHQQQQHQQKMKPPVVKMIETTPALTAAESHKIINKKPEEEKQVEINEETIKQHLQNDSFVPNISQVIRFSSVPSGIARENLGEEFQPDVFTILDEMESPESSTYSKSQEDNANKQEISSEEDEKSSHEEQEQQKEEFSEPESFEEEEQNKSETATQNRPVRRPQKPSDNTHGYRGAAKGKKPAGRGAKPVNR